MLPLALVLSATALIGLVLGVLWLGARRAGYRHLRATISELGEQGAADQKLCAYAFFLPLGLLLLGTAGVLRVEMPAAALLALCLAVGYVGAAIFPCDPGSPLSGSTRQELHNLAGGIEYLGGAWALYRLTETHGGFFRVAALLVVAATVGVSFPHPWRGAVQRVAEACLFGGLLLAIWQRLG